MEGPRWVYLCHRTESVWLACSRVLSKQVCSSDSWLPWAGHKQLHVVHSTVLAAICCSKWSRQ